MTPSADARAALIGAGGDAALATARFRFPADLPVLRGHFPGAPLVPGVHLLACVLETAARALERPLALRAIERAKWSAPVRPDDELACEARIAAHDGGWRIDGAVRSPAGICATCRLLATSP